MKLFPAFSPGRIVATMAASLLLTSLFFTTGCIALLAGAGAGATVAYVRGDLDVTLDSGFAQAVRAAEKALAELKYAKISANQDALQATLISRTSSDQRIELYLERATAHTTKLKIRVGTFGEETLQQQILALVKSKL
ncbi:MAG: DUF3568 domain-containing protein [Cephaloticoccus sp.]|nr:DUF3568 domain-containing protein [Cephaloticoccus sp.]MCF7761162.1 DUF3568 domain-containing protein [Cephaloticoccus sp.]